MLQFMLYIHAKALNALIVLLVIFYAARATASETLSGTVRFPDDPMRYGDSLVLEVSLLDVSQADAGAITMATNQQPVHTHPMAFRFRFDPHHLTGQQSLTLQAVVLDPRTQRVLYRTTQSYPVTEANHRKPHALKLTNITTNQP